MLLSSSLADQKKATFSFPPKFRLKKSYFSRIVRARARGKQKYTFQMSNLVSTLFQMCCKTIPSINWWQKDFYCFSLFKKVLGLKKWISSTLFFQMHILILVIKCKIYPDKSLQMKSRPTFKQIKFCRIPVLIFQIWIQRFSNSKNFRSFPSHLKVEAKKGKKITNIFFTELCTRVLEY